MAKGQSKPWRKPVSKAVLKDLADPAEEKLMAAGWTPGRLRELKRMLNDGRSWTYIAYALRTTVDEVMRQTEFQHWQRHISLIDYVIQEAKVKA